MQESVREPDQRQRDVKTQPSDSVRYPRLEEVDRQSAESLAQFCHANYKFGVTSSRLSGNCFWQSLRTSLPLVVADVVALWLLLYGTSSVAERVLSLSTRLVTNQSAWFSALLMLPIARLAGLYPGLGMSAAVEFRQIIRSATVSLLVFAGIGCLTDTSHWHFYLLSTVMAWALAVPCFPAARFLARQFGRWTSWWGAPLLIHAPPKVAVELYQRLDRTTDRGLRPAGVLLSPEHYWEAAESLEAQGIPTFDIRNAQDVALKTRATWVVTTENEDGNRSEPIDPELFAIPNRILLSSTKLDIGMWDRIYTVGTTAGLRVGGVRPSFGILALKRAFDLVLTTLGLIVLSPFIVILALAVKFTSKGPIVFGQQRVGLGGRMFTAWKFRTMVENADDVLQHYLDSNPDYRREWDETHKLKNDPRVTSVGRILRATSMDELPQLFNVLMGHMSLVGPRPIIDDPKYDACYVQDYPYEFEVYKTVRPGLSGLWQVSCRNNGVYELRIYWDMYYVRNWSLWLDLYIIMRTFRTILLREGQ